MNYPPPQSTGGAYPPPPQYGQQQTNYQTYEHQPGASQQPIGGDAKGRFEYVRTGPKYHDLWATLLFAAHFVGFVIISGLSLTHLSKFGMISTQPPPSSSDPPPPPMPEGAGRMLIIILSVTSVIGALLCAGYVFLMQRVGRSLIKIMFVGSIVVYIAFAVIAIIAKVVILAVIYVLLAIVWAVLFFFWRSRIPLAALIMETCTSVAAKYSSVYSIAFMSLFLQFAYAIWWSFTIVGASAKWGQDPNDRGIYTFLGIYLVFSFYWTTQILQNTLHVTVAGTFASFYFLEGTSAMPARPSLGAAKRAFTTSFGPIAFGSLIVALVQLIRYLLRQAAQENGLVAACVDCLMSCIQGLIEYFNKYAFIQVAIYGKSFCDAAKSTWNLIKTSGVDAIINDSLIGVVLSMGSILVGMICAGVAGIWGYAAFSQDLQVMGGYVVLIAFAAFFIGVVMMSVVTIVIDSGASTTFVCVAEDPSALARTKPELYQKFQSVYPQISWRV